MNRVTHTLLIATIAATVVVTMFAGAEPAHSQATAVEAKYPPTTEGDFVVHNFKFDSGETLADLNLHYTTLGKAVKDGQGRTTNAVLILHGTGGSGHQFL